MIEYIIKIKKIGKHGIDWNITRGGASYAGCTWVGKDKAIRMILRRFEYLIEESMDELDIEVGIR